MFVNSLYRTRLSRPVTTELEIKEGFKGYTVYVFVLG